MRRGIVRRAKMKPYAKVLMLFMTGFFLSNLLFAVGVRKFANVATKIRKLPDIRSKQIGSLVLGQWIDVLEETGKTVTIQGVRGKWVKVEFTTFDGTFTGFAFGPHLVPVKPVDVAPYSGVYSQVVAPGEILTCKLPEVTIIDKLIVWQDMCAEGPDTLKYCYAVSVTNDTDEYQTYTCDEKYIIPEKMLKAKHWKKDWLKSWSSVRISLDDKIIGVNDIKYSKIRK